MKCMWVMACALLLAAQANSALQEKEEKTVRVIVFSPQLPGTAEGKIAKAIKDGTFTAIEIVEAKSTPVKLTDVSAGKNEKPIQETYYRQKISVSTKKEQYHNSDVFFSTTMTKGYKLTNFVERGRFSGKMGTAMSHHYVIYEATIVRP